MFRVRGILHDNRFVRAHHDAFVHERPVYRDTDGTLYHLLGRSDRRFIMMPCTSGPVVVLASVDDLNATMSAATRDEWCLATTRWRLW